MADMLHRLHPSAPLERALLEARPIISQPSITNAIQSTNIPSADSTPKSVHHQLVQRAVKFFATHGIARVKARSSTLIDLIKLTVPDFNPELLNDRAFLHELQIQGDQARAETMVALRCTGNNVVTMAFDGMTVHGHKFVNILLLTMDEPFYWTTLDCGTLPDTTQRETELLNKAICELRDEYSIRIHALVCDNANNVKAASKAIAAEHHIISLGCSAHQLQLIANEFLTGFEVETRLSKFDQLIRLFTSEKGHKGRSDKLKSFSHLTIVVPNITRWFGRLYSYQRLADLQTHLDKFDSSALDGLSLDRDDWVLLGDVIVVLEAFLEISDILQSDLNTVFHTYQAYCKINDYLRNWSSPNGKLGFSSLVVRNYEWEILQLTVDKWRHDDDSSTPLKAVEALDVRQMAMGNITRSSAPLKTTLDWIVSKGAAILVKENDFKQLSVSQLQTKLKAQVTAFRGGQLGGFAYTRPERVQLASVAMTQINKSNFNLFEYWTTRQHDFEDTKELATFANILLRCISTEAAVERSFSSHNIIHSDLRNRLNVQHIRWEMHVRWANRERSKQRKIPPISTFHSDIPFEEWLIDEQIINRYVDEEMQDAEMED